MMCTEPNPKLQRVRFVGRQKTLRSRPYTVPELLDVLRKMGAKTLVLEMSRELGVAPVQKERPSEH